MKVFRDVLCFLLVLVVLGSGQHVVRAANDNFNTIKMPVTFLHSNEVPEEVEKHAKFVFDSLTPGLMHALGFPAEDQSLYLSQGTKLKQIDAEHSNDIFYYFIYNNNAIRTLIVISKQNNQMNQTILDMHNQPDIFDFPSGQSVEFVRYKGNVYAIYKHFVKSIFVENANVKADELLSAEEFKHFDEENGKSEGMNDSCCDSQLFLASRHISSEEFLKYGNSLVDMPVLDPLFYSRGVAPDNKVYGTCWLNGISICLEYLRAGEKASAYSAAGIYLDLANKYTFYPRNSFECAEIMTNETSQRSEYPDHTFDYVAGIWSWNQIENRILSGQTSLCTLVNQSDWNLGHFVALRGFYNNYYDQDNPAYYYIEIVDSNYPSKIAINYANTYTTPSGIVYNWVGNVAQLD